MNNQSVIVSKVVYSNDFEIVYKLVSYENEGFSSFNDKWYRSDSGEVMDDRGINGLAHGMPLGRM